MASVCKLLSDMIADEKNADTEYNKLEKVVSRADKWQIKKIKSEERTHKEELTAMAKRYHCNI